MSSRFPPEIAGPKGEFAPGAKAGPSECCGVLSIFLPCRMITTNPWELEMRVYPE